MAQKLLDYYKITEIKSGVYRIFSPERVHVDLFVGRKAALLFDTGYGFGPLSELVKSITQLPLYVVNSHGHLDHACGNFQFEENIYIHPKDMELCQRHNSPEMKKGAVENAKHTIEYGTGIEHNILPQDFNEDLYVNSGYGTLVPVIEGHTFELGGITLKVVELPGHTQGGIGLIYEEEQMLYAGDALNSFLWLFMPEATDITTYIATIKKAMQIDFEKLVMAHNPVVADKLVLDDFLDCALHIDFANGIPFESPLAKDCPAKICTRTGFGPEDMEKPGFASIVISESHLK